MATTINAGRVRFVSRGTYNNSTQYYLFDLVDYNGSSYIAKENTIGNLPTNTQYWQLIAEKGNTGSTGATGATGATGNGIASITKTGTVGLVDTYTITYTNGNTTTFTITNGEDGEVTETELDVLRQKVANQQKVIDQLPQVTGQGTEVTLENTIEAPFTKFDVEGNSTQDGEPNPNYEQPIKSAGDNVNLLPNNIISQTLYGVEITKNKDGSVKLNGTSTNAFNLVLVNDLSLPTNQYTMSLKNKIIGIGIYAYVNNELKAFVSASLNDESTTFTLNENTIFNEIRLYVPSGSSFNNLVVYPKLEKGNKATPYSPYGMGSINEKISNGNNFDGIMEQGDIPSYNGQNQNNTLCIRSKNYILLQPSTTYFFERFGLITDSVGLRFYDKDKNYLSSETTSIGYNVKSKAFTTGNNVYYMRFTDWTNNFTNTYMLSKGNKSVPYVPHEEQDYPIFVQQPFRSNKDKTIKDKFVVKSDGKLYERHYIGEKILNGTENWSISGNQNYFYYANNDFPTISGTGGVLPDMKCNYYQISTYNHIYNANDDYGVTLAINNNHFLALRNKDITTIAQLKTELSTHNLVVQYPRETPLDLPCTPEQIQQLENLPSTYKDFTIIQSEDETEAYLEVSGIYDLNKLINN